jgi:phage-related minor tail protein
VVILAENLGSIRAEIVLKIDTFRKNADSAKKETKKMVTSIKDRFNEMKEKAKDVFKAMQKASEKNVKKMKNKFKELKDQVKETIGTFEEIKEKAGESLLAGGTLALTGLTAMTAGFNETDKTMRKFQAQTGLTGKELKKFNEAIESTYLKGYGEDLSEVTDAYQKYQRSLKLSAKETKTLVEGSFILRDLFEYDIETTLQASSSLIKNFGINGQKALDIITLSAQKSGDRAEDLLDTFMEYSQQFKEAGFTAEEFSGMLVKGLQEGQWNTDQLGDSVKEFQVTLLELAKSGDESFKKVIGNSKDYKNIVKGLKDGTMSTADVMKLVNSKLKGTKDQLSKNELGVALYGSLWEDVGGNIITSLTESGTALKNFDGANKKVGKTMKGNNVTMEKVGRQFKTLTDKIGAELAPYLAKIINKISEVLKKLLDFSKANPEIAKVIAILGVLAGIISTVIGVIILIYPYIQIAITVFSSLWATVTVVSSAIAGFVGAIGALPIIIGVAIIALVVLIIMKWEEIKEFTINIWNSIVEFFKSLPETLMELWTNFTTWLGELFVSLGEKSKEIWNSIVDFIKQVPSMIFSFFTETLPFFIGWVIGRFIKLHIDIGKAVVNFFINTLPGLISKGLDMVVNFFTKILPKALVFFTLMVVKLLIKANEMRSKLINYAGKAVNAVINWFKKLPGRIGALAGSMYNKAKQLGSKAINGIKSGIKNLPKTIYNIVKNAIKGIGKLGRTAWKALKNIGSNMWNGFKKGLGISSPSYIERAIFDIQDASDKMTSTLRRDFTKLSQMPQITSFAGNVDRGIETLKNVRNVQTFNAPVVSIQGSSSDYVTGNNINKDIYKEVLNKMRGRGV